MRTQHNIQRFSLAAGQSRILDSGVSRVSRIIVSLSSGVLDVWEGEWGAPAGTADWRFRSGLGPWELSVKSQPQYRLTLAGVMETTAGSVTFVSEAGDG